MVQLFDHHNMLYKLLIATKQHGLLEAVTAVTTKNAIF
jgi:hypothetical protein